MKGKQNWIHFSFGGTIPMLKRDKDGKTTPCGKTARRISVSKDINMVTCPRCIEGLRRKAVA